MAVELQRSIVKRHILLTHIRGIIDGVEAELNNLEPNIETLKDALGQLPQKESQLHKLNEVIEELVELPELSEEINEVEKFSSHLMLIKNRAARIVEQHRQDASTTSSASSTVGNRSVSLPIVRLPKLEMKRFSGNVSDWQSFWSLYKHTIHENCNLSKLDKFNYLHSYLEGVAERAIANIQLTEANYETAIKILKDRFGVKDLQINSYMNVLLNLAPVSKTSDVRALRTLYETIEIQVRGLGSLGLESAKYGSLLCPIILQRVPEELTKAFTLDNSSNTEWELDNLLTFLNTKISAYERAYAITRPDSEKKESYLAKNAGKFNKNASKTDIGTAKPPPSAAALNVNTNLQDGNRDSVSKPCPFCDDVTHGPKSCTFSVKARREIAFKKRMCFICLRTNHQSRNCRARKKTCSICQKRHHSALCDNNIGETQDTNATESEQNPQGAVLSSATTDARHQVILMQTAQGIATSPVAKPKTTVPVRIILDSGSHLSFITEETSRRLKLPVIGEENLELFVFGHTAPENAVRKKVLLELQNLSDPTKRVIIEAIETPKICGANFAVPGAEIFAQMQSRGLSIADKPDQNRNTKCLSSLDILIGSNHYWEIATGKTLRLDAALVAMETMFGWIVQGPSSTSATHLNVGVNSVAVLKVACESDEKLISDQLRAFWDLEALGITDQSSKSVEHSEVLRSFEENITLHDGRYQVSLPWKIGHAKLASNYAVAAKRTENLVKKLRMNPVLFQQYDDVIQDQLHNGIIEEVSQHCDQGNQLFYLPHRGVIRENHPTTRLRVVFDASAHAQGSPSLNDCLEAGPNLNPDLLDILLRFRENPIAFTSDIEKAFLQISIAPKDRDAIRFLWVEGITQEKNRKIKTFRIARVAFGVTSSPFLLMATIRHHTKRFEEDYPEICQLLQRSLFVDDLVSGASSVSRAHRLSLEASNILKEAGFNLRKWRTNSPDLQQLWEQNEEQSSADQLPATIKVLGISWNIIRDQLTYDLDALVQFIVEKQNTKRWVLKAAARVYDPLGLISPFTIRAKFIFQALWEKGLSWDDQLSDELAKSFDNWCLELTELHNITIPRFYYAERKEDDPNWQLHCFVDASERAYAAVIYAKYRKHNGSFGTSLVVAKTRLAPLKKLTLPRLELMAALIGARLTNHCLKTFSAPPSSTRLWTDSKIALHWIHGSAKEWKPFISNRVREIQTLTDPMNWSHCSGKSNPADVPTRGRSVSSLQNESLWWNGPNWLTNEDVSRSSTTQTPLEVTKAIQDELRSCFQDRQQVAMVVELAEDELLDANRFSSYTRLTRITGWIQRFCFNCKNSNTKAAGELTAEELSNAENFWVRRAQTSQYSLDIHALCEKRALPKTSKLRTLNPIIDNDGILRVGGRLKNTEFTYSEKHPRILPPNHHLTDLIAKHHHNRVMHGGTNETLVDVRERYWVIRGRQVIKRAVQGCTICRRFRVKPSVTVMAPLPLSRTSPCDPFEVTGLDFAGPLYTKNGDKSYIALFTCAVTRAVHLELVSNVSTDCFLMAFRRFVSRRGVSTIIYSDNAKTFIRADADIKHLFNQIRNPEVEKTFGNLKISWRFITDRSPWQGGFYERLVRSVKNVLRKVLGQARLSYEELETTLIEAEAVINSRPLTYVYPEVGEPYPLTPAHFLVGKRLTALPSGTFPKDIGNKTTRDMVKRWQFRQTLNDKFWNRWKTEYLLELRSAHHVLDKTASRPLQKDDVYRRATNAETQLENRNHHGNDYRQRWSYPILRGKIA